MSDPAPQEAAAPPRRAATPAELFARLESLGIRTRTLTHEPFFTVHDGQELRSRMPGAHCKSLFLKDKKGALWLVVTLAERRLEMTDLARRIGAARLSFGKPELLAEALGVTPGSVTPFAVINDPGRRVSVILDKAMMEGFDIVNYHPLTNRATTAIAPADLLAFIDSCGHRPRIVDLGPLAGPGAEPC
ncbi:MAG: prolyl-tRNA synthetase associated domain-containing protein [Proteobacteria bacterium]|nr:prolyl-tRNA synthetase associated domain-containing protein [Pseudomonadota bacterium]